MRKAIVSLFEAKNITFTNTVISVH